MAKVLEIIFKKAMEDGEILEEWREANICPLFKKGSKMEAASLTDFGMLQSAGRNSPRQHFYTFIFF